MDVDGNFPDQDELTEEELRIQIEDIQKKRVLLQVRHEQEMKLCELQLKSVERKIVQKHVEEPPTKKSKENNTEKISEKCDKRHEENVEQGKSTNQITEENCSATDEISTEREMDQHRKAFEKLIDEYRFPHDISKCGRKKIIKKLKFEFFKKIKRKKEKAKKKAKNKELLQQDLTVPRIKTPRTKMSESTNKTRIAIDCSFDSLMTDNDVQKLSKQIQRCYSLNRKMTQPFQLHFTQFTDKTLKRFDAAMDGYKYWDVFIKQESLAELYSLSEVVYLCAESENVIQTLDDDKLYVIGGFVDHNYHKGVSFDRAQDAGFSTARLPIDEYFKLATRKVLTVCHVFEIISHFSRSGCWKEAIWSTVPRRKGLEEHGAKVEGGNDDPFAEEKRGDNEPSTKKEESKEEPCANEEGGG